jgi:hypothetical protein
MGLGLVDETTDEIGEVHAARSAVTKLINWGWSYDDIAEYVGVDPRSPRRWHLGRTTPKNVAVRRNLARLLRVQGPPPTKVVAAK